jgi:hypothetical protein
LRAKYFPFEDLKRSSEERILAHLAEYMGCIRTFKKGHIWCVGSESNIHIWDDEWVPGSNTKKVFMPKGQNVYTKVEELIGPISKTWNEELIEQTLWPIDRHRILSIPIPTHDMEDFVGRSLTKTGVLLFAQLIRLSGSTSSAPRSIMHGAISGSMNPHPMWEVIWKLKCPSKVKIFLWRVMKEKIPRPFDLANRHVKVSGQCPLCEAGAKDVNYLLFQCKHAKLYGATWG